MWSFGRCQIVISSGEGAHHQLLAFDFREAGVVLDLVRGGQLAASGDAESEEALIEDRYPCQSEKRFREGGIRWRSARAA
jgi:hypothetical protein